MRVFQRLLAEDSGQDLIEYALLIAFIALVAAGAVSSVGQTIYTVFYEKLAQNLFG
jgi:Flp pilus assembly pilin Flp